MIKKFLLSVCLMLLSLPVFAVVNVAFNIDNNYPIYTMITIKSIVSHSDSDFMFYILQNDISDKNKKIMTDYVKSLHQNIEFIDVDMQKIDGGNKYFTFSKNRITPIAMARIVLPNVLKNVDKVIYLDADLIVNIDLAELYNIDMGNLSTGMCTNISSSGSKLNEFKKGYFNSGVILMDLKKWREQKISEKLVGYLQAHSEQFIYDRKTNNRAKYLYPDQDLLNLVLEGKIYKLNQKWNNQTIKGKSTYDLTKPCVIHYVGPVKPWHAIYAKNIQTKYYFDTWRKTPFYHYRLKFLIQTLKKGYVNLLNKKINRLKKTVEGFCLHFCF